MNGGDAELAAALRLGVAGLIGLGVGLEREWSGHATGPAARFAGLRTFLLLGFIGGTAGLLLDRSHDLVAALLVAGGAGLGIAAYVMAVRRPGADLDGTTETAAVVVVALGTLAGIGWLKLSAGAAAVVVLALSEKKYLHWLVRRIGEEELRAGLQFAVLALVVLPLLPEGPFLDPIQVRPRALWSVVLLFTGLDFAGYLAIRAAGAARGYRIAGLLGGTLSSTVVTLDFSRLSRAQPAYADALATGVLGACLVLLPRVTVVSVALNPPVALALLLYLLPAAALGVIVFYVLGRGATAEADALPATTRSPLRLMPAIRMAIAFQIAISVLTFVRREWGAGGLYASAALLGLTDVDALTVSLTRAHDDVPARIAAQAIAVGILANTMLKLVMSVVLGTPRFRRTAGLALVVLAVGSVAGLWIFWAR